MMMTRKTLLFTAAATVAPTLALTLVAATSSVPSTAQAQNACPASQFINVAAAVGGIAAPSLSVSCSGGQVIVTSNGVPGYQAEQTTPNALKATAQRTIFPAVPRLTGQDARVQEQVGVSLQGIPIVSGRMGPVPRNQAFGDAHYNKAIDRCDGHSNPTMGYHLHGVTNGCIASQSATASGETIIGYALDGFPIVLGGNWRSGYVQVGNPQTNADRAYQYQGGGSGTLDACNGRSVNGSYQYHVTNTWPYTVGCFKGATLMSGRPGGGPEGARGAGGPGEGQGQGQGERPPRGPRPPRRNF